MSKQVWVEVGDFADMHDMTADSILAHNRKGTIPAYVFKKEKGEFTILDARYFTRRKDFKQKILMRSHEMYYFLTRHISTFELAGILESLSDRTKGTWNTWMADSLFTIDSISITNLRVTDKLWEFYRICRALINRMFRKLKIKNRDLSILIER